MQRIIELIGKNLESADVTDFLSNNTYEVEYDEDFEEYYVTDIPGQVQLICDSSKVVETACLKSDEVYKLPGDLTFRSVQEDVYRVLGEPANKGAPLDDDILPGTGGFDRYDGDRICTHYEYCQPNGEIKMKTIMASHAAP